MPCSPRIRSSSWPTGWAATSAGRSRAPAPSGASRRWSQGARHDAGHREGARPGGQGHRVPPRDDRRGYGDDAHRRVPRHDDGEAWVTLNIGDSRVYLLREGVLDQITTDHSVVQELVAAGRLSPEEAESHPYGNVITRAVGPSETVTPDYVRLDIVDGDRFVICSDGLTKELTDYGIGHFLNEHADPEAPWMPCWPRRSRTAAATTSRSSS